MKNMKKKNLINENIFLIFCFTMKANANIMNVYRIYIPWFLFIYFIYRKYVKNPLLPLGYTYIFFSLFVEINS